MMAIFRSALLVSALFLSTPALPNYVSNGSFEDFTGSFGADGGSALNSSSTTLTDWTIIDEVAVLTTPNVYNLTASDGTNFLDLTAYNGVGAGSGQGVQQTVSGLTVNSMYHVSMDIGINNSSCGPASSNCEGPVSVFATIGNVYATFVHDSASPGNVWGNYSFDFIALSSSVDLQITMVTTAGVYVGLDNVSIADVPEPASSYLLICGIAALGTMGLRRKIGSQASVAI